ncbi:MAG: hypothetical protein JXB34_01735 [Bacteroidales bacterium]|nr:hypothetical protein [Bacteroidales bacterium]
MNLRLSMPKSAAAIFLMFLLSIHCTGFSQEIIDSGTVKQQFDFVIGKSTRYNEYQAVRASWLEKLKRHSLDSLQHFKSELARFQELTELQAAQIDSLANGLGQISQKLETAVKEKNAIGFLGLKIEKAKYNALTWSIITGLLIVLTIGYLAYKGRNSAAKQHAKDLSELKDEFDAYRKRALEREQKMARQHLDEINKYRNQSTTTVKTGKQF